MSGGRADTAPLPFPFLPAAAGTARRVWRTQTESLAEGVIAALRWSLWLTSVCL